MDLFFNPVCPEFNLNKRVFRTIRIQVFEVSLYSMEGKT